MEGMECGSCCGWTMVGYGLLWWVVASLALFATWNHVVAKLFKAQRAKWWHPFLVLFTAAVLCAPCMGSRGWGHGGGGKCPFHGKHGWMHDAGPESSAPAAAPKK